MKNIFLILTLAILYFVTGEISFKLSSLNNIITVGIFIPEGISLAFALYFGKRVIPGVFIGQLFLAYFNGIEIVPALLIASINSIEALLGIFLFKRFKLSKEFKELRDVIGFTFIIAIILQPFSAIFSNFVLFFFHNIEINLLFTSISAWWFGNVMGQMLITPFLLILFINYKKIDIVKYLTFMLLSFVFLYSIEIWIGVQNPFLLFSLTIPFAVFVVAQTDLLYGTLYSIITAIITSLSVYIGIGAFHLKDTLDNTINYNLFIFSHIAIILFIGALFEEKRRHEKTLHNSIAEEVTKNKEQQLLMLQQNRLAQMGEMISMIAHQWRQPLNNLSLINQLLISKYNKGKLDSSNIEYFKNNSEKQITLMSKTIDDFRNFFQSEKVKEEFIVNKMIETILDMLKDIYASNGISIKLYEDGIYKALGCPNTLSQAILNVINNARDALLDSEIKDKKIKIRLRYSEGCILLSIQDNAGGVPENIIDKIFDPYFSTKQDKNGTGLGLYMSKMIINEQGNAKISVKNIPSYGASFTIYLQGKLYANK